LYVGPPISFSPFSSSSSYSARLYEQNPCR